MVSVDAHNEGAEPRLRHEIALPLRALRCTAAELRPERVDGFDRVVPTDAFDEHGVLPTWRHVARGTKKAIATALYEGLDAPAMHRFGRGLSLRRLGVPGAVVPYLADGGQLLAHLMRLHHAMEGCAPELERSGDRVTVHLLEGMVGESPRAGGFVAVCRLAEWIRETIGESPVSITVQGERPSGAAAVESTLRCPIRFRARTTSLSLSATWLGQRLPTADVDVVEALRAPVEGFFDTALSMVCMDRVQAVVAWELRHGPPRVGAVARRLAVSPRSLQRYLASEAQSFRGIVHDVRRATLTRLLAEGIDEPRRLSECLGGLSPKEVRRLMAEVSST